MAYSIIRMKKRKMFVHLSSNGERVVASGIVLQYCPNDLGIIRVGFTVTKRVGGAVIRNRVRRRLREVVRLSPDIGRKNGMDYVFIGRVSTLDRPFQKLKADLRYLLKMAQTGQKKEEKI